MSLGLTLTRTTSNNSLERQLSIEETYALHDTARRKSSSSDVRHHLRLRVGHSKMLDALEHVIRTSSPPSSPPQSSTKSKHIRWSETEVTKRYAPPVKPVEEYDELGFAYEDDEEEIESLSLMRTTSRHS